jgi:hypothetical protein
MHSLFVDNGTSAFSKRVSVSRLDHDTALILLMSNYRRHAEA